MSPNELADKLKARGKAVNGMPRADMEQALLDSEAGRKAAGTGPYGGAGLGGASGVLRLAVASDLQSQLD